MVLSTTPVEQEKEHRSFSAQIAQAEILAANNKSITEYFPSDSPFYTATPASGTPVTTSTPVQSTYFTNTTSDVKDPRRQPAELAPIALVAAAYQERTPQNYGACCRR